MENWLINIANIAQLLANVKNYSKKLYSQNCYFGELIYEKGQDVLNLGQYVIHLILKIPGLSESL